MSEGKIIIIGHPRPEGYISRLFSGEVYGGWVQINLVDLLSPHRPPKVADAFGPVKMKKHVESPRQCGRKHRKWPVPK